MSRPDPTPARTRTRVRRLPEKGVYDAAAIAAILDEGLVAHLGIVDEGVPFVVPVGYARDGDAVLIHGSTASRAFTRAAEGAPVCLTVTLLDGVVVARSVFNASMNYRSVMVLGSAVPVDEPEAKLAALRTLSERLIPGHWDAVRRPSEQELKATRVLRLPLDEASAKVSSGPPEDEPADRGLPSWAGVIPLRTKVGEPEPDPLVEPGAPVPAYVAGWQRLRAAAPPE